MDNDINGFRKAGETGTLKQRDEPPAPMRRTQFPDGPWEYSTDDPIPIKILMLQDYYSKYVKASIVNSTGTKEATDFLERAFEEDGIPNKIISDNGPPFQGKDFAAWCKARKIKVTKSTPELPRSNGMVGRFMLSVTRSLTALKLDEGLRPETARNTIKNLPFQLQSKHQSRRRVRN